MSTVDLKAVGKHELAIEWIGSVTNDMIADSVIALVLGVDRSPASVKSTSFSALFLSFLVIGRREMRTDGNCTIGIASTTTHSHSHSHVPRHPHAEPISPPSSPRPTSRLTDAKPVATSKKEEKEEVEESLDPKSLNLPTRLDRLIAFLDSYFGSVELLIPTAGESTIIDVEIPSLTISLPIESEAGKEVGEGTKLGGGELVLEGEGMRIEKREVMKVPVIRVWLDENFADVTVENLVRSSLSPSFLLR